MSKFHHAQAATLIGALSMSVASLAHAGDDRYAGASKAPRTQMSQAQVAQAKAMKAKAMQAKAMQMRMMQARQAQAAQAQAAKAGMAAAMVTAATLAATDAGECSPYLAKWMMTRNPLAKIAYDACMED